MAEPSSAVDALLYCPHAAACSGRGQAKSFGEPLRERPDGRLLDFPRKQTWMGAVLGEMVGSPAGAEGHVPAWRAPVGLAVL